MHCRSIFRAALRFSRNGFHRRAGFIGHSTLGWLRRQWNVFSLGNIGRLRAQVVEEEAILRGTSGSLFALGGSRAGRRVSAAGTIRLTLVAKCSTSLAKAAIATISSARPDFEPSITFFELPRDIISSHRILPKRRKISQAAARRWFQMRSQSQRLWLTPTGTASKWSCLRSDLKVGITVRTCCDGHH